MESRNFLGSIKSRTAYGLVRGLTMPNDLIITESTSGNLGLALNFFCEEEGRSFLCLLDETVIDTKYKYLLSRGINCEIVQTVSGFDGRASRMKRAKQLSSNGTHYWINQYDNEDGVLIHEETTAPEIIRQTNGEVTCIICAVGSGGTIAGVGEYLAKTGANVKLIGVEPYGSTIFHTVDAPYITAGAGLRGKPGNLIRHPNLVNESMAIIDEVSIAKCKLLNRSYKVDVGITTGMTYAAAEQYCTNKKNETIVVISADGGQLYGSYL
jgi:cysteine synthase A